MSLQAGEPDAPLLRFKKEENNMRHTAKLLALLLAIGMLAALLVGCSGGADANDPNLGTYKGVSWCFVTSPDSPVTDEEFSLELKAGGKGVDKRDGYEYDVNWKLDGENFEMTESFLGVEIKYTGTLKDGKLDIFNGDPEDWLTVEYIYEKQP